MSLLDQEPRSIIICDNGLMNLYLRINHLPAHGEWKILNIEIYTSLATAQEGRIAGLVADDVQFATLPESTKMAVWGALDEAEHAKRERANRLKLAVASIMNPAVTA